MMSSENPAGSGETAGETAGKTAGETAGETAAARPSPADALDVAGGDENVQLAENVAENETDNETGRKPAFSSAAPAPETPSHAHAEKRLETVENVCRTDPSSVVAAKTRELWSLASAGAAIRARAAAAADALRAIRPVRQTRSTSNAFDVFNTCSTMSAAAAELVAVDLDGVLAAMEGAHGDDGSIGPGLGSNDSLAGVRRDHSPIPGLLSYYSGQSLRLIEETSAEASSSPSGGPGFDSKVDRGGRSRSSADDDGVEEVNEAERLMRAADDEARRSARAASARRLEKARTDAARELARWPGYRAALDAVAAAAIASGRGQGGGCARVVRGTDGRVTLPGGARFGPIPTCGSAFTTFTRRRRTRSVTTTTTTARRRPASSASRGGILFFRGYYPPRNRTRDRTSAPNGEYPPLLAGDPGGSHGERRAPAARRRDAPRVGVETTFETAVGKRERVVETDARKRRINRRRRRGPTSQGWE